MQHQHLNSALQDAENLVNTLQASIKKLINASDDSGFAASISLQLYGGASTADGVVEATAHIALLYDTCARMWSV